MHQRPSRSSRNSLIAARSALVRTTYDLNLFSHNPFWSPSLNFSEQILSTRLFLLFLFLSLLIVITYASLIIRTHSVTLTHFSLSNFEDLHSRYSTTIDAPCTQVSNPYHKFIYLSPKFHQVCSSPFISDQWISSLFLPNATSHNILDFRTFTFAQFQALALLCHTAYQSVHDGYHAFNSTHLITNHLLARAEFKEIANVLINNLQNNILANENRTGRIVSMSIAQNRIMSALRTNVYITSVYMSNHYITHSAHYSMKSRTFSTSCECRLDGNRCVYPAGAFYNWTIPELDKPAKSIPPPRYQIPGLMAGCLPLESIRRSTLECLYQQSCIKILSLQPNISQPKALQKSLSKFPLNSTIGSIYDRSLFVESWQNASSFEDYFTACAPRSLTYSYQGRFRLDWILTICVSAFGGLVIVWQLITPVIVKIWSIMKCKTNKQKQPQIPPDQMGIQQAMIKTIPLNPLNRAVTTRIHRTIYTFNLFLPDDQNDLEEQHVGIIATRLYIFFLFSGLVVIGFYTFLAKRTQTYIVKSPSLTKFEQLEFLYGSTLTCSCSRFSMSNARIMSISPRYHQICSSEFIKKYWLSYFDLLEIKENTTLFATIDFRNSGRPFFNLIRVLCQTARETVQNAIRLFQSRRLVSATTLSHLQFHDITQTRLQKFEQGTITSFINLLELVRSSIQTNRLVSSVFISTDFAFWFDNQTSKYLPRFYSRPVYNSSCSCDFSSRCTIPQGFYLQPRAPTSQANISIPGLVLGCYTIDSVLFSTLECLFEQKCLQLLIDMYHFDAVNLLKPLHNRTVHIRALRPEMTRFSPNSTLESIVSQLFVEDWRSSQNFTAYYLRCAPTECTYSLTRRFDKAYMLAMMLGFYSGLSAILGIILPLLVRFTKRRWKKSQQNIDNPPMTDSTVHSTSQTRKSSSFSKVYQSSCTLNLFRTKVTESDYQTTHEEIIATRIYLILLLLTLITALLYAGPFSEEIKTTIVKLPTSDIVNTLHAKNISSLSCPCSTVAIPHAKFLSIIPHYHSICSSDYVTPAYWIKLADINEKVSQLLSAHYYVIASLCQTANRTINSAQDVLSTHELITVETMTRTSFFIQTDALLSTFISQIPADYRRTLKFITRSFGVNHLFNVFTSNWKLAFTDENEQHILSTYPRRFTSSNCTCATSFDCTEHITEDVVHGCFLFDGFRLSKFENLSLTELNDKLFVEIWQNQTNYNAYFQTCHPLECRYTLSDKNNPKYMSMTILGLYGGLTYVLRLIVGQSLYAYQWWSKTHRQLQLESLSSDSTAL